MKLKNFKSNMILQAESVLGYLVKLVCGASLNSLVFELSELDDSI